MTTKYPPTTIELDVYYYEDEETNIRVFDEEEMKREFEKFLASSF